MAIGLSSTCGFVSLLYAIKFLPLSVALPLSYLYPALGALMSPLINREKPTKTDWLAIILAFAGVCLLGHSTAENKAVTWVGLAWAMGASFWLALMSNLTRRQAKAKPGYVIVFYLFLVNLAVCLPVSMIIDQPVAVASKDFFYLAGILSPLAVLAIICMSIGFKHLSAHRGGVILTMEAVTAALFGLIFLHEPLTLYVGIGGLLLIVSAGIIAASKQK